MVLSSNTAWTASLAMVYTPHVDLLKLFQYLLPEHIVILRRDFFLFFLYLFVFPASFQVGCTLLTFLFFFCMLFRILFFRFLPVFFSAVLQKALRQIGSIFFFKLPVFFDRLLPCSAVRLLFRAPAPFALVSSFFQTV